MAQADEKEKNPVWKYFDRHDKSQKYVVCNICKSSLSAEYGNTSNLRKHLQNKHKLAYDELRVEDTKNKSLKRSRSSQSQASSGEKYKKLDSYLDLPQNKWKLNDKRQQECNKQLARMVCTDFQPLSIVEDEGFRNFVYSLQPAYNLPDRRVIRHSIIPELYRTKKEIIQDKLQECSTVSVTLDHWTSLAQDAYMAVTVHFLTPDFDIQDYCLNVKHMPQSHDAVNISGELHDSLNEWIPDYKDKLKKIYTVTDNAANVKAAMRLLPSDLFKPLYCFAHTLQLAVNDAVDSFPGFLRVIKKAKVIVNHFSKSAKDTHKLSEIQNTLKLKQHKIKSECPTRWNSLYHMIERLVEQKDSIAVVLALNGKINNLQNHEWKTAERYVSVLKIFEDATSMMSASRYPTLSMVLPVLNVIKQQMAETELDEFGKKICDNLDDRWGDYERNLDLAIPCLLDPRFKEFAFTDENAKNCAVRAVIQLMTNFNDNTKADQSNNTTQPCSSFEPERTPEKPVRESVSGGSSGVWTVFKKMVAKRKEKDLIEDSKEVVMQKEFSLYCTEDLLEPEGSPFNWWKENRQKYPNVSKIAQIYLSIPATSVASERLFSKAGLVVSQRRSCLKPSVVEQLVFLGHNLRQ